MKLVDSVEVVDKNGLTILANTGVLLPNANVTTTSDTSLEINGTAFSITPGYLDTVTALNRRVRITTRGYPYTSVKCRHRVQITGCDGKCRPIDFQ